MKKYGVNALAKLSGVSVRTLHYYDEIGLLKPTNRTEAGYRFYGDQELLRLQQILFFRELGFPLKEITGLLEDPGFRMIDALESHRLALAARKKRIDTLLATIDKTIHHLKEETIMSNPEMLYDGLPKEVGTTYRKEAIDKYGKEAVEQSETALLKMGKEGMQQLKQEQTQVGAELFALRYESPESEKVQLLITRHYDIIRKFWGTVHSADKQAEAYAGLGDLYVSDERFSTINGVPQPEYALFLQKAMKYFAERVLK